MFRNTVKNELSPEALSKVQEILGNKSPEELANLLDLALTEYAIGPDGQFTENFKNFLTSLENGNIPSGPHTEETFSFFDLLLLLNKLSSNERDGLLRSSQLEQQGIQATFKLKIDNIRGKAAIDLAVGIASVGGGALSLVGGYFGGLQSKDLKGQMFSSLGRTISEITSSGGSAAARLAYDPEKEALEAKQQQANFSKDTQSQAKRILEEQIDAATRSANDLVSSTSGVKSRIAGNV